MKTLSLFSMPKSISQKNKRADGQKRTMPKIKEKAEKLANKAKRLTSAAIETTKELSDKRGDYASTIETFKKSYNRQKSLNSEGISKLVAQSGIKTDLQKGMTAILSAGSEKTRGEIEKKCDLAGHWDSKELEALIKDHSPPTEGNVSQFWQKVESAKKDQDANKALDSEVGEICKGKQNTKMNGMKGTFGDAVRNLITSLPSSKTAQSKAHKNLKENLGLVHPDALSAIIQQNTGDDHKITGTNIHKIATALDDLMTITHDDKKTPMNAIHKLMGRHSQAESQEMDKMVFELQGAGVKPSEILEKMLEHTEGRAAMLSAAIELDIQMGNTQSDDDIKGIEGNKPGDEALSKLRELHKEKMGAFKQQKAKEAAADKKQKYQNEFSQEKAKLFKDVFSPDVETAFNNAFGKEDINSQFDKLEKIKFLKDNGSSNKDITEILNKREEYTVETEVKNGTETITTPEEERDGTFYPKTTEIEQRWKTETVTHQHPNDYALNQAVQHKKKEVLNKNLESAIQKVYDTAGTSLQSKIETNLSDLNQEQLLTALEAINKLKKAHHMDDTAVIKIMDQEYSYEVTETFDVYDDDKERAAQYNEIPEPKNYTATREVTKYNTDALKSLKEAAEKKPPLPDRSTMPPPKTMAPRPPVPSTPAPIPESAMDNALIYAFDGDRKEIPAPAARPRAMSPAEEAQLDRELEALIAGLPD